jgi:hypothetical protein
MADMLGKIMLTDDISVKHEIHLIKQQMFVFQQRRMAEY